MDNNKALSPVMKQYYDLKKKHPDAMLLFRTGDFYEMYCEDAEKSARILGITLTRSSKEKDKDGKPLAIAGFPYHAIDTYLPKLIRAGARVAICDAIEAPTGEKKAIVKEKITPIISQDKKQEEFDKKVSEVETKYNSKINDIARETIKALNGSIPTKLNSYYSDVVGKLNWIKLKNACNAPFTMEEVNYLINMAEIGIKSQSMK